MGWAKHGAAVVISSAAMVIITAEFRLPVESRDREPESDWMTLISQSQQRFGTRRPGNHCPAMFGVESMRADLVKAIAVERERNRNSTAFGGLAVPGVQLYAWAETEPPRIFLTSRIGVLSPATRLAMLFHEVRGHIELRYSDAAMQSVLCPGSLGADTHCITLQIERGCPTLLGLTPDNVLARMGIQPPAGSVEITITTRFIQ